MFHNRNYCLQQEFIIYNLRSCYENLVLFSNNQRTDKAKIRSYYYKKEARQELREWLLFR